MEPSARRRELRGERDPWPLALSVPLVPLLALWTLPQTLAGLAFAAVRAAQGHRSVLLRYGPFLELLVRAAGPATPGISLGLVAFADRPALEKHELSHLVTGLWLGWAYLPVYGIEYLVLGHDRSPHERLTCHLERTLPWRRVAIGRGGPASTGGQS